jgi:Histidine kinase-, DNA gyrase B-, and HSP90-like ATPase
MADLIEVRIGPETVKSYKRLAYEAWWALAEFIDNSSQSYFSNRSTLDEAYAKSGDSFEVLINYDRDNDKIRISDTAMGMSLDELSRAVKIGTPPPDTTGRSEFGMGLKTAACWLGDCWTLRTSKLGDPHEYEITFDVESVANGDPDLHLRTVDVDPDLHYTILTIEKMHQKISGRRLGSLKENLRSIYRLDTRSGDMHLCWGDESLVYDQRLNLLQAADGSEFRREFTFQVNGRNVWGWAGILDSGGRPKAGFAIVRRGRLIQGQPEAWRPQTIFGQQAGSNDLINQRIVGEIHLDDFLVSHTKNQILWQGDELDEVEDQLREIFADYRHIAQTRRVRGEGGPSTQATTVALDEISEIVSRPDFADLVNIEEVPAPEIVGATLEPLREAMHVNEPDATYTLGETTIKLFLDSSGSANDPYFLGDFVSDQTVSVCVNTNHKFFQERVQDAEGMLIYTLNCIYDALAEWKCMRKTGEILPDTVKVIKDSYMRMTVTP